MSHARSRGAGSWEKVRLGMGEEVYAQPVGEWEEKLRQQHPDHPGYSPPAERPAERPAQRPAERGVVTKPSVDRPSDRQIRSDGPPSSVCRSW